MNTRYSIVFKKPAIVYTEISETKTVGLDLEKFITLSEVTYPITIPKLSNINMAE